MPLTMLRAAALVGVLALGGTLASPTARGSLASLATAGNQDTAPAVGATAPDFSAPAADASGAKSAPVSLAAQKGKVVVLAFYPADRTSGCTAELTKFRDDYKSLFGDDVVVLPVSKDDLASHAAWAKDMSFPFPLLSDPQLALAEKYGSKGPGGAYASRTVFVIGRDGKVAYRDLRFNALSEGAYTQLAAAVAQAKKG